MVFMRIRVLISIVPLLCIPVLAQATSFIEKAFPDAVEEAPVIVRGTIGMSYSDYGRTPGDEKRIYTYYELVPSEVFKGAVLNGGIIVRQIGGSKDGLTMEVPGTARFSRGEDVVVMLGAQGGDGTFEMQSLMMGKFTIERVNGKDYLHGPGAVSPEEARDGEIVHPEELLRRKKTPTYTVEALRELVRTGKEPERAAGAASSVPSPVATPSGGVTEAAAEPTATPGLQTAPQGETAPSAGEAGSRKWIFGAILLGLWFVIRTLRRSSGR
jgi:hypothetical protein